MPDSRFTDHKSTARCALSAFACALAILLAAPGLATAADLRVNAGGDAGDGVCDSNCTLRDALTAANGASDSDSIDFASTVRGTLVLTEGELPIAGPVSIEGPGADLLAISGDADSSGGPSPGDSRIFAVDTPASASVAISGLTLTRGYAVDSGGAVATDRANLSLVDITISESKTDVDGGAVHVGPSGRSLLVEGSTLYDNDAAGSGGAIALEGPSAGAVIVSNATIAENGAGADGGGIHSLNPSSLPVEISNSTVAYNAAAGSGGGIFRSAVPLPGDGTIDLSSSIVAENQSGGSGPDVADETAAAGVFNAGFSLIGDASAASLDSDPVNSNRVGVDPRIRSLENTGGTTPTISPRTDSPALDAGVANGLTLDQRGYERTVGIRHFDPAPGSDRTDIGSVELRYPRVRFNSGPKGTITRRNVKIEFSSATPGAEFSCSFNFRGFEECNSPFRIRGLREGYHLLEVRARTEDGLIGRAARRGFVIDRGLKRPRVKTKRVQRLERQVKVRVDASAREDVVVTARGFLRVPALGRVPLKKKKLALPGHRVKRFNLKPRTRRSARRVLKATRKRKKAVARVTVTMADRGGYRFRKRVKIRLKR